jgi:uncharacterized protein (TIGR04222 family)
MPNPFDLPGPQFLVFYAFLGTFTVGLLWLARRASEPADAPRIDYSDPYLLACLRGGEKEVIRVVAVSLIDRGLLQSKNDDQLVVVNQNAVNIARLPIEKALLQHFRFRAKASSAFASPAILSTCQKYKDALQRSGLLPDESILRARLWRFVIAVIVLTGVAALKILIALQRGRTNIFFLILLAVFFVFVAIRVHNPLRTRRGDALLADLRHLFSSLKARARMVRPGGETADAVLLMAVFGLDALPAAAFPYAKRFQPKNTALSPTSCGSACGSSCGSSCGGGGGCGGCGGS